MTPNINTVNQVFHPLTGNTPLVKLQPWNQIWFCLFLRPNISQSFPIPIESEGLPHFLLRPTPPRLSRFIFPPLKSQTIILYISIQLLLILLYFHPVILKEPVHIPQAPFSQVSSPPITNFLKPFLITPKLLPLNPQWPRLGQVGQEVLS
jgi:hypothetical protein